MSFTIFKINVKAKTDEELMVLVINNGHEKAFEELYDRYCKKLVWFSARIVLNKAVAEDIVQDVFMKIIDNPKQFNPSQKFSTWVYTLVNNASINTKKYEVNRERLLNENFTQITVSQSYHNLDAKLIQQRLNQIFAELNSKEQLVFTLRLEHKLSIKEIAKIADMPEGTVKSCLYYLLKKIALQLKDHQLIN